MAGSRVLILTDEQDRDIAALTWHKAGKGYAGRSVGPRNKHRTEYAHRKIMARILGREIRRGEYVDHRNHDPLDNRRANLRLVSNGKNMQNRRGLPSHNKSGYRGVCWDKRRKNWVATVIVDRKRVFCQSFTDAHAAGAAAAEHRKRHGFLTP